MDAKKPAILKWSQIDPYKQIAVSPDNHTWIINHEQPDIYIITFNHEITIEHTFKDAINLCQDQHERILNARK